MSLTRKDAALKLGMKVEEIRGIERDGGRYVVTTHDGTRTEIDGDVLTTVTGDGDTAIAEVTPDGPELVQAAGAEPAVVDEAMALPIGGSDKTVSDEMVRAVLDRTTPEQLARLGLARVLATPSTEDTVRLDPAAAGSEGTDEDDEEPVPDGSAEAVLNWVGNDKDRAQRAFEAEQARERPRSTVLAALEKLKG